jgi:hypothetical protein
VDVLYRSEYHNAKISADWFVIVRFREMRGRPRIFSVVAILVGILGVSAVFATGVVNPSVLTRNAMSWMQPDSPGPNEVFVIPAAIIKDYVLEPGYQIGDKFTVYINVTSVTDLFTWQLNFTWDPAILNFTKKITYGDFLNRTTSPHGTSRITRIVGGDNVTGDGWVAETILGDYAGVTGSGRLVSIEFLIVGYGKTDLIISSTGILKTTLLNSAGVAITFTAIKGYFDNRISGDITGPENPLGSGKYPPDRLVDGRDLIYLGANFGTSDPVADFTGPENPVGSGTYPPDGLVDGRDLIRLGANFGRSVP